jgi:probable F420-dependent oxidoreductase
MRIGVTLRNMGRQSDPEVMRSGARFAESIGFESVWITDHIAIPPDNAEGSGGRYTDPLTTLAWLAGATATINVAVGVLIVPYRPALPTAKQVATLQELSGGRLLLGLAVGWMDAEFKALGVNRHQRGKITDETLEFFAECFDRDVVTRNGQEFIFSPRPAAPPIYIGGNPPHALRRALRFGHGWLPMVRDPETLKRDLALFRQLAAEIETTPGPVTAMAQVSSNRPDEVQSLLAGYRELGVERLVCGVRYETLDEYKQQIEELGRQVLA